MTADYLDDDETTAPDAGAAVLWSVLSDPYVWPGAYARWIVLDDGEILCRHCAAANAEEIAYSTGADGWSAVGTIHDGEIDECAACAHCGDCAAHPVGLGRPDAHETAVCTDCYMWIANGDDGAEWDAAQVDFMRTADVRERATEWYAWGYDSSECEYAPSIAGYFSWSPCHYCRRPYSGGTRYAMIVLPAPGAGLELEAPDDDDGRYVATPGGMVDRAEVARCQICGVLEMGATHDETAHERARREMGAARALVVALIAALVLAVALIAAPVQAHPAGPDGLPVVYEDSPAWNCAHMGNRECGPGVPRVEWWMI